MSTNVSVSADGLLQNTVGTEGCVEAFTSINELNAHFNPTPPQLTYYQNTTNVSLSTNATTPAPVPDAITDYTDPSLVYSIESPTFDRIAGTYTVPTTGWYEIVANINIVVNNNAFVSQTAGGDTNDRGPYFELRSGNIPIATSTVSMKIVDPSIPTIFRAPSFGTCTLYCLRQFFLSEILSIVFQRGSFTSSFPANDPRSQLRFNGPIPMTWQITRVA